MKQRMILNNKQRISDKLSIVTQTCIGGEENRGLPGLEVPLGELTRLREVGGADTSLSSSDCGGEVMSDVCRVWPGEVAERDM